jgi:cycloartenol synthase
MPYASIDWNAARSQIAKEDLYYPHPMIQVRGCVCLHVCAVLL